MAYEGALKQEQTTIGKFGVMDFTDFNQPGDYQLKVGKNITPAFRIGEKLWDNSLWKVLNFLFCQRCGHPVPANMPLVILIYSPGMTEKASPIQADGMMQAIYHSRRCRPEM